MDDCAAKIRLCSEAASIHQDKTCTRAWILAGFGAESTFLAGSGWEEHRAGCRGKDEIKKNYLIFLTKLH